MRFTLRMRDLEKATSLPASAIRYYLREGLLPEPERPTVNSALYGQIHIDRIKALQRIKAVAPELPLVQLKRVLELVGKGVEPEVALSLHRSVGAGAQSAKTYEGVPALAKACGIDAAFVAQLIDARIVVPVGNMDEPSFNDIDRQIVATVSPFRALLPDVVDKMTEIAAMIRGISDLEMSMRNSAAGGTSAEQTAQISYHMQEFVNLWHAYLFARFRLRDIAEQGLGPAEAEPQDMRPSD